MSNQEQRQIPLLDLKAQNNPIRDEIYAAIGRVFESQHFILGEDMRLLEKEIAGYCGVKYAVGCASGTDALYLALCAAGVKHGDAVLTTPFSFFATVGAVTRAGATPVFVDIDPATFNMDPGRLADTLRSHPRAKAVLPVHLYGASADMDPINDAASLRDCVVIEDAAQAIGSEYKGRRTCGLGLAGCLSFFPSKNLGALGDGGMVTTNDESFAVKLAALRLHGETKRYHHEWIGTNSRLDTLQAAVLRAKLPHLDEWTEARRRNAGVYARLLAAANIPVRLPVVVSYQTRHVFNQFVIRCERRDTLREYLSEKGIGTQIYYPVPLHMQKCFRYLGYRQGDFPEAEKAAAEVLALPVYNGLQESDIQYICDAIREFYNGAPS